VDHGDRLAVAPAAIAEEADDAVAGAVGLAVCFTAAI
jgi:hypothetical protein